MAEKSKWLTCGSLRKGQDGSLYITVTSDVTLTKGMSLQLQDPRKTVAKLAEKGFMTAEVAEERIAKIPEYVKYDVVLPPPRTK
jgi:hypothetical protein